MVADQNSGECVIKKTVEDNTFCSFPLTKITDLGRRAQSQGTAPKMTLGEKEQEVTLPLGGSSL